MHRLSAGLCLPGGSTTIQSVSRRCFDFKTDMDLIGGGLLWYERPQLFFHCTKCPTCSHGSQIQHKELSLVFVSTFESLTVTPNAMMQLYGD